MLAKIFSTPAGIFFAYVAGAMNMAYGLSFFQRTQKRPQKVTMFCGKILLQAPAPTLKLLPWVRSVGRNKKNVETGFLLLLYSYSF
jgi:hypothetical protein